MKKVKMMKLADSGKTVLVSTHDPELIEQCCDLELYIEHGRVLMAESVVLFVYSMMSFFVPINVALVFILVLLLEMGEVFYNACEGAIIPLLVDEDKLKDAIAVSKSDDGIVFVISPIIAAFIFTNINLTAAFVFVTILDFAAGILQFSIKIRQQKNESDDEKIHFIRNFKEGVHVILENNKLRNLAMTIPVINAFFGATFSVSILIQTNVKKELLGRVTTTVGMLSMISVAIGEMLFGVLNDMFIVYVSIFIGAIGVGIGSIMYSIVDKYHIYTKREEKGWILRR